jgi:hypothetical protein
VNTAMKTSFVDSLVDPLTKIYFQLCCAEAYTAHSYPFAQGGRKRRYFDSSSDMKTMKNYGQIKSVLDDALQLYADKGGKFTKGGERVKNGKDIFMHHTKFSCIK